MAPNLGTKRQCPKCAAKFYDLGASGTITCPKCGKSWEDSDKKAKAKRTKKVPPPPAVKKPLAKKVAAPGDLPDDLPEVEEGDEIAELEPMEDEGIELVSLEEVEEHEEEKETDAEGDDAEDDMFTEMPGQEKLVDDLEQYIEKDEDEDEDGEEE